MRRARVVIVDDIISTAGPSRPPPACSGNRSGVDPRGLPTGCASGAYMRLRAAGIASIASSDTYENASSFISAANAIVAAVLEDVHR